MRYRLDQATARHRRRLLQVEDLQQGRCNVSQAPVLSQADVVAMAGSLRCSPSTKMQGTGLVVWAVQA
jgi:hypothetical protein